jgi:hypothetical protein
MDDLAIYIINYYSHLMTLEERVARQSMIGEFKIQRATSSTMKEELRKQWISEDPKVLELLSSGPDAFMTRVRDRVMRDHADEVFLNYCPRCGALAKTPTAKQCPKCFFSWHDDD